ncbi:MAG: hypothetical protein WC748_04135 [Legionellales bacterium]|jgi:hypothetical protein
MSADSIKIEETKNTDSAKLLAQLWSFILILTFYKNESYKDEESKKKNEEKLETAIALLASMRDVLAIRTASSRAFNFNQAHHDESIDMEHDESVFALISLLYLLCAAASVSLANKALPIPMKNKLIYEVIDTITWSAIALMRLPGTFVSEMDSSEWAGMSDMLVEGFVVGCYGIELFNQLRYDYAQYLHYNKLLETTDPNSPDYQYYEYERSKCSLALTTDFVHLTSMVVGVALQMAGVTPIGLLLMVAATIGNQFKNLIVAFVDLHKTTQRATDKYNNELATNPDDNRKKEITEEYQKTIRKAEKKFANELAKLAVIFVSVGLFALGGPAGAFAFAAGIAAFITVKSAFYLYEKYEAHQENKRALLTVSYQAVESKNVDEARDSSPVPSSPTLPSQRNT